MDKIAVSHSTYENMLLQGRLLYTTTLECNNRVGDVVACLEQVTDKKGKQKYTGRACRLKVLSVKNHNNILLEVIKNGYDS